MLSALDEVHPAIATVRRSRKPPREIMEDAILHLCQARFRTAAEIAADLNRAGKHLGPRYLGDLVARGKLEMRYPDRPSHPDQAYRTVKRY